jgi:predicted HTH domain antitoxin
MAVMSLRLGKEEIEHISKISNQEKREKSASARELLNAGWTFRWLKLYRLGKVSLGKTAEQLNLSVGEVIDLLAELGIEAPIKYDDYLEGFESLKR